MTTPSVRIDDELAVIEFDRFDLDSYAMFQRTKALPESWVTYDWQQDRYTVSTAARFAPRLGGPQALAPETFGVPFAPHLFDYQRWCLRLALDAKRFAAWLDCVAGETVLQTPDGEIRIDEAAARGEPIRVWSLDRDGSVVAALASAPFRKGRAEVYDFELDDGSAITVTRGHRFLTPQGWKPAGEIVCGDSLAVCAPEPPATSSAFGPSMSPRDALCLTDKASGSTDRYSLAVHRCDRQPLWAAGSVQARVPSRVDARGRGPLCPRTDDLEHKSARTRRHRDTGRPSTLDSHHPDNCALGAVECHVSPSHSRRLASSKQALWRSGQFAILAQPTSESGQYADRGETAARSSAPWSPHRASGAECQVAPSPDAQALTSNRVLGPSLSLAIPPQPTPESAPTLYPTTTPSAISYRRVVRVQYNRTDDYYDLHVPGYENYLANGIWNHNTGLGKGPLALEWCRQVQARTGGRVLYLMPLAVIPQIREETQRFYGDTLPTIALRNREELIDWCASGDPEVLAFCNYEKFIPGEIPELRLLAGLVADESSMLKTGGGTIKWNLIKSARGIEFKLSCTATPAPNDAMEYASQAAFLETLRSEGEILWTYFHKGKDGEWSVKPHARAAFYRFMASWSLYLRDPKAFGFGDILASLPEPEIIEERCPITGAQRVAMTGILVKHHVGMFGDDRLGVTPRSKLAQLARGFLYHSIGKDRTIERFPSHKVRAVADFAIGEMQTGRPTLVWTSFDTEAEILQHEVAAGGHEIAILTGSTPEAKRLAILEQFRAGEIACLISKPALIGYGLNLQFVKSMVFSGIDDSFERMYQAIRRAYRLGQTDAVRVFVPYVPELEGLMFDNVRAKETRFLSEVAAQEQLYRVALRDELEVA